MSFYNTTNLEGEQLLCEQNKTENQKDLVLQIFRENQNKKMTWEVVYKYFDEHKRLPFGKEIREGSIKRAITDLYKEGAIKKTSTTVKATYGFCHQYYLEVIPESGQVGLFV